MLFLLAFYYLGLVGAAPAPFPGPEDIKSALKAPLDQMNKRTLLNIVYSCSSTILGCTWIAIHPNIPKPEAPGTNIWDKALFTIRRIVKHKLPPFIMALLVPEYLLAWAIRQWLIASELRRFGRHKGILADIPKFGTYNSYRVDSNSRVLYSDGRLSSLPLPRTPSILHK